MPNPCGWEGALLDPPLGPTVDDQVTAIAAQPDRKPTTPIDVAVDGCADVAETGSVVGGAWHSEPCGTRCRA